MGCHHREDRRRQAEGGLCRLGLEVGRLSEDVAKHPLPWRTRERVPHACSTKSFHDRRRAPRPQFQILAGGARHLPVAACRPIAGKFVTGSTACKPVPQYTGSDMLGIGVVHKSGLQPVFSQEQAEDLAKMRR